MQRNATLEQSSCQKHVLGAKNQYSGMQRSQSGRPYRQRKDYLDDILWTDFILFYLSINHMFGASSRVTSIRSSDCELDHILLSAPPPGP